MFVLDSHCDTPSQIHRLRNLRQDNARAHVDFPKLRRGGVNGALFALYTPASLCPEDAFCHAQSLLSDLKQCLVGNTDIARLTRSKDEALRNSQEGIFSVFLSLENASPLKSSLEILRNFSAEGVRCITLVHSADNDVADSCSGSGTWGGLSTFGRELLVEMDRLSVLPDVSHCSDEAFRDIIRYAKGPVVATHSSCRSLCNHRRNLTDDMIRAIAATGGCVQINIYPSFIDAAFTAQEGISGLLDWADEVEAEFIKDPSDSIARENWLQALERLELCVRPSYKKVVDHIEHVIELVGTEHVGIGTDFDGIPVTPEGLEDVSGFPLIFEELRQRGYSESEISLIAGGNFLKLL